ncbi:unnamed protein product [Ostreobium quekettii]|uniref:Patatin n=1 Tax=Ostreobium quekettii TaxID=121088 RepID=A0A8S1IK37_9CHLO|nr:unnamed protein product [Ostreobium quekettii]|eukprot:evm.model.scf_726.1 EVM.evm.TU.scf_726.1   scf_726:2650-8564(+)
MDALMTTRLRLPCTRRPSRQRPALITAVMLPEGRVGMFIPQPVLGAGHMARATRTAEQPRCSAIGEATGTWSGPELGWITERWRPVREIDILNGGDEGIMVEQGPPPLKLAFSGGGIFFWWELGCVQWLSEHYDLKKTPMVGASGGALVSTLAATGVEPERALECARRLGRKYEIWERPLGLMGVWGQIIREWLDELLPNDAADLCRGNVEAVVTKLPFFELAAYSDFKSKEDLIDVNMASAHVPFLLDGQASTLCRGSWCIDGSFQDFVTNSNSHLLTCGGNTVIFDYSQDDELGAQRMDFLSLKEYEEVRELMELGYRHAQRLYDRGAFDKFDVSMCQQGWSWRLLPQWSFSS